MKKSKIKRFLQDPSCCAIASIATIAHSYNKKINYNLAKFITKNKIGEDLKSGLDTGQMALLLNYLGFNTVSVVSSDIDILDYSWENLSKNKLIEKLKKFASVSKEKDYKSAAKSLVKWLSEKSFNNNLIIDYNFSDYIRESIDLGNPVLVCFNWTMFFRQIRYKGQKKDDIKGEYADHAVVIYSYNDKGVKICDSHHEYYKYRLKDFREGFYNMSWENLMTTMGFGDVFLVEDYDKERFEENIE